MADNSLKKDDSTSSSLMELLRKYTTRVDEQEITRTTRPQQKSSNDEIEKSKDSVNKSQSKTNFISDLEEKIDEDKININYKMKWKESEMKYRQLEKKYQQLENETIKQLQDKINKLQQDSNQLKLIKERINELSSCRQLTNYQFEQLKFLVNNNNNDNNHVSIETIANKNDFHQQTIQLRSILLEHNEDLLNKIENIIKKKRKEINMKMMIMIMIIIRSLF